MKFSRIIHCLFFSLTIGILNIPLNSIAQTHPADDYFQGEIETHKITEQSWKAAVQDIDYSAEKAETEIDNDEDDPWVDDPNRERQYNDYDADKALGFWTTFFKILFVLFIIAAIALIAYFLIGENLRRPKNKIITPTEDLELALENLDETFHESDLDRFIRQALEAKNYGLAIRLYYLAVIKELSEKHMIKWKRDKTNRDYIRELRQTPLAGPFKEMTRIFERVWYGNSQLDLTTFNILKPQFEKLIQNIQQQTT